MPQNRAAIQNDPGASFVGQGYAGHYCAVPQRTDPGIVACSFIVSGLRVFDIRDPYHPKEIAYFNAPVKSKATPPSPGGNYAMSAPAFALDRGEIWYSDVNQGFFVVRLTSNAATIASASVLGTSARRVDFSTLPNTGAGWPLGLGLMASILGILVALGLVLGIRAGAPARRRE